MPTKQANDIQHALQRAAASLREAGIDFALGGGLSVWARGGPATEHDDDLLVEKLLSMNEHYLDFGPPLEWARSLREQVDWVTVERRTDGSPLARTFLHLLAELGVIERGRARMRSLA